MKQRENEFCRKQVPQYKRASPGEESGLGKPTGIILQLQGSGLLLCKEKVVKG